MQTPNLQASNRLEQLLLVSLLLCAFGLRVYAIDGSSLWSDEGNTWALLSRSFSQIAVDSAADIHPPGYYWLLKGWSTFGGDSAAAMRLFSAFAGTLLVLLVFRIGRLIDQTLLNSSSLSTYALLTAFVTALNPLQIFYSQEARMYMPLALVGSLLVLGFMQILRVEEQGGTFAHRVAAYTLYTLSGILGLWLHYSFPICLAAVGLPFLASILFDKQSSQQQKLGRFIRFALANVAILVGYSPWISIGIDRIINWPKGGEAFSAFVGIEVILRTFVVGPLRSRMGTPLDIHWVWLLFGGLLPLFGLTILYRLERRQSKPPLMTILLSSWLFLPLLVMLFFGLFTEAFLKFLLVAAPAWSLALAAFPLIGRMGPQVSRNWGVQIIGTGVAAAVIAFSWSTLPIYYTNSLSRDNYAGIARYIEATATDSDAAENLVVLNAPGQQEVWQYYSSGPQSGPQSGPLSGPLSGTLSASTLRVLALPAERPIDEAGTVETLAQSVQNARRIFALFWATDEADPNGVVEKWLDQHAFKGLDSWQGNVRFVRYDLPSNLHCISPNTGSESETDTKSVLFGTEIELTEFCEQSNAAGEADPVRAGESVLIGLRWQTLSPLDVRYKTTLQLLDARNQVIAQRDSHPGGGSMPTDSWQPNTQVIDNYGIVIPPGTPPGSYTLILALYDTENGQRLSTGEADHLLLSTVEVMRPERPMPAEVLPIHNRIDQQVGPVTLVGYDLYPKGYAHQPDRAIAAGELVHVTLYWQAPMPLPAEWPADLQFTMTLGNQQFNSSLVSAEYATSQWKDGEFVRGEFDILFNGSADQITIEVEDSSFILQTIP